MPATLSTAAAAITFAVSLVAPDEVAQAATTPPAPTDATPTRFYWPWEDWTQPWATVIAGLAVLIAAFITLIIAWLTRRQTDRHWTATNRQQRFVVADPNPAVRIAGTAAMETLTDD